MKWIVFTIAVLHGLIHLLGFVKGFEIKEVKELTLPVSKTMGILWLSAAVLFILYGVLFITNNKYAWFAGIVAVMVSQVLILMSWKDAGFGTSPNVVLLMVSLTGLGSYLIQNEFSHRVKSDFATNNQLTTGILTEADMEHLPAIVRKYLFYTKAAGQPKIKNFRAEFVGGMRSKPEDKYMKINSVQYNFYQEPSRYFYMEASKMGMPATGLHLYQNETASFEVKMLNWLKVVDARGERMNQAETVTLLNDMCFIAPATLIDKRISWELVNDTTVKAIFINGKVQVSAMLWFNKDGELQNFLSNDRYETDGRKYNNYPWETPVEDYRMINGYFLPGRARLIYKKPEGDFTYGELEYKNVKYNLNEPEE